MIETTLLVGLVGGLIATVVTTVFMLTLGDDSASPTVLFWSKYVGGEGPVSCVMQGVVRHMLYGVGTGVVLAALLPVAGFDHVALVTAIGAGLATGVRLFVGAGAFRTAVVLALDPDQKRSDCSASSIWSPGSSSARVSSKLTADERSILSTTSG